MSSETAVERRMLEDSWRARLEKAETNYDEAHDRYRRLLEQHPDGATHNLEVERARAAESKVLSEYSRVLRIFTDLRLNGKIPEEQPGTEGA